MSSLLGVRGLPPHGEWPHAARGEIEEAFSWLECAYRAGWLQHELLRVDPLLDSLRDDERLAELEAEMKRNIRRQRERLR